jgi:cytochrome c oxidase subunit I+III
MHQLGLEGMPRRVYTYLESMGWHGLNLLATIGAAVMAVSVLLFLVNVVLALRSREPAPADPWGADTLEWATSSPPPSYNFHPPPVVHGLYARWTDVPSGAPTGVSGLRPDRRELLATRILDATPDYRAVLPGPSYSPLLLAITATVAFLGAVYDVWFVPIGAGLSFLALVYWHWPGFEDHPHFWKRGRTPMSAPVLLDVSRLPTLVSGRSATVWWAMVLLLTIETIVFGTLAASYFYLAAFEPSWPPPGTDPPSLLLPTLNTGVLLMSSLWMRYGDRAMNVVTCAGCSSASPARSRWPRYSWCSRRSSTATCPTRGAITPTDRSCG